MINEKLRRLLQVVKDATARGSIEWTPASDGTAFNVVLGAATLEVDRDFDEENDAVYSVLVKDSKNKIIEHEIFFDDPTGDEDFDLVEGLYDEARRGALKIDQILDSMISAVKKP
jgi:hypothetical protein